MSKTSDIVKIISSDEVEMEIERFYLMAGSHVFREMMADSDVLSPSTEPILIDAPAKTVAVFLSWLRHEPDAMRPDSSERVIGHDLYLSLVEIWRKYDSDAVKRRLESVLVEIEGYKHGVHQFWWRFLLAAEFGAPAVGRAVIEKYGETSGIDGHPMDAAAVVQLPIRWFAALAEAGFDGWSNRFYAKKTNSSDPDMDWSYVATCFLHTVKRHK